MGDVLGIIAGGGELPCAVAQSAREVGRGVFVVAISGMAGDWAEEFPHAWISIGEPGRAMKALAGANVGEVVLVGKVDRPKFSELKLDAKGVIALPRALAAARRGDDALLRMLVDLFAENGFSAVGVAEAAPGLVVHAGPIGRLTPTHDHLDDIAQGFRIVRAIGVLDVGQAAVVCEGLALAVEAAEGTDAMIARVANLREHLRGTPEQRRGVLVKALKPTQDAKTDMPVIGVETVRRASAVGLAGIALEAGGALVMDRRAVAETADELGLFVMGCEP